MRKTLGMIPQHSPWIQFVKQYQHDNNCSYKEALSGASKIYSSQKIGGSMNSGYIRKLLAQDKFDINKIKKPEKLSNNLKERYKIHKKKEQKPKEQPKEQPKELSETETIIQNWNDVYLGYIIDNTNIGQNIQNMIDKKNKKNEYIIDVYLVSFTKNINDEIIKRYGVEALFDGINRIAEYMGADKYVVKFGVEKSLPINKYFSKQSLKLVNEANLKLIKNEKEDEEEDFDKLSMEMQQLIFLTPIEKIKKALVKANYKGRMHTQKVLLIQQLLQNFDTIDKLKQFMRELNSV